MNEDEISLVIDNGSRFTKSGFSGDCTPKSIFPTVVGTPKSNNSMVGLNDRIINVGHEPESKRNILNLNYPIEQGLITNWEDIEKIWSHTFYLELRIAPEEHSVLLAEVPLNPKQKKEKTIQIMFETFSIPSFYPAVQSTLSLYSSGRTEGIVLDSGDSVTHVVPIYEGFALNYSIKKFDFAGRDITENLMKALSKGRYSFSRPSDREIARDIKEKFCYVALNLDDEYQNRLMNGNPLKYYELPDGEAITIEHESFSCPELLFKPNTIGIESEGIHEILHHCIEKSAEEFNEIFYKNIILSGGTTMLNGINQRLQKEMEILVPTKTKVKVVSPPERQYSTWLGGSILSSMSTFKEIYITKKEYEEYGPSISHRKCF